MKTIAVIPARYASTRMPGKPLADVLGKPMIYWVYKAARACPKLDDVLIATDDGSVGYHGFVDALVRRELEQDKNYDAVLACGPKPMLRNVAKVAEEFGVPCQVSMEERMGCGIGACLVCACDMKDGSRKHVCKDGPVFESK